MIDLETLGTNVDSQILSIGACAFGPDGISDTFYTVINLPQDQHVKTTPGTLAFWLGQGSEALSAIWATDMKLDEPEALIALAHWLQGFAGEHIIWANGTKFDLGMLEHAYKEFLMTPPWFHNADRCMRTLRAHVGRINIDFNGIPHHALDDAKYQALYVIQAHNILGLEWE